MTALSGAARRAVVVRPARYVLILVGLSASSACLVPPDSVDPVAPRNYPPEIVLDSVSPKAAVLDVTTDCPSWRLSARVFDPDDDVVVIRFVADNGIPQLVKPIEERVQSPAKSNRPEDVRLFRDDFPGLFDREMKLLQPVRTVSMFVTDAPSFLVPTSTTSPDYSRIDPGRDEDGAPLHSVVEFRWPHSFRDNAGTMPVCP